MTNEQYFAKLQEISELSSYILNDLESNEHANQISQKVTEIFEVDACVIRFIKGEELYILGSYGVPQEKLTPVLHKYEGLAKRIFETFKPQSVYDINAEPIIKSQLNKRKNELKFVSYAGAPLIADKKEIGIIGIYRIEIKRDFTSSELHLLQLVSNQVALRLENSQLFVNLLHKNSDLEDEIQKRKLTETQLIRAKEAAEYSDKVKSEFLAQVSHEIRSPLAGMLSFISLVKEATFENNTPEEELKEYFNSIEISGGRLVRTIDLLLNVSEVQNKAFNPIFEDINLIEIISNLTREYRALAVNKNLELISECDIDNLYINGDQYSVVQILSNLVDNAIKYTNSGYVKVICKTDTDGKINIFVEDSGIGMSKEFMAEIFKPFTQEDTGYTRKFDGSGLGLSLVKSYCDINNIKIEVESEKNKGSKFILTFDAK
ncbi:MAG: hypothetical protein SCALA702_06100 [Melioribacteraceae bacterium]|nr:MAG: hypothetical protein SCALA702_06100 [Melioribacteraceae bacterium]